MRYRQVVGVMMVVACGLLAGCEKKKVDEKQVLQPTVPGLVDTPDDAEFDIDAPSMAEAVAAQHFIMNNNTEPETLDPAVATGVPENRLISALFEGLLTLHPKTLEPVPGMAERWEISADRLVYTFHLRADAKWSDGMAVTAQDFVYSWERVLNPDFGASYASQLFPVAQAEAYNQGKLKDFSEVGVKAVDTRTLQVTLHAPCPYFLSLAAFNTLSPVPRHVIMKHGNDRWTAAESMVSNGAFMLEKWQPKERIELVRNPQYWDRANVALSRVTVLPLDNIDTAYKLYTQGKIHWLPSIPLGKIDEIKRNPDYYRNQALGTYFYRFNVKRPPFDDARVRRAFSMAINRREITENILRGGQEPAGWFCPAMGGYEPIDGVTFDAEGAKRLLAEAGYGPGGRELPPVEIIYNTLEQHQQIAEYVTQQWQTVLGAKVSARNLEWGTYLATQKDQDYQTIRSSWMGDYRDPNTFFDLWASKGGNNRTGWGNDQYDAWLKETQVATDPAARNATFRKMEQMVVVDEAVIMPIYIYVNQGMRREEVTGWYANLLDQHPLKHIRLDSVD